MHVPNHYAESSTQHLVNFIEINPLGTLVSYAGSRLDACHVPFKVAPRDASEVIVLQGHIARANDLWREETESQRVLTVFHGPNAYVSPNHYPSKLESGKVVPTWNYSTVHAKGTIKFIHDEAWLFSFLERFTDHHESKYADPWKITDAPSQYIARMLNAIVGLEITVESLVGNFKLSQNKADEDRQGVISGLASSDQLEDQRVSEYMQTYYTNKEQTT